MLPDSHRSRMAARVLPWVIATATALEYFDNALFSFFAVHIAGGINASPDELVWASSAYAVAAVLGILQQQWWVGRVGYRRYVAACLLLFSVAALAALASTSPVELAFARGAQGYLLGPMMGACRILIQADLDADQRPRALRIFLIMILLASALAPLAGGALIAAFGWRALFGCTAVAGALMAPVTLLVLPHSGTLHPSERGEAHFWPYVVFALAQCALQVVMQQVRFELFGASPMLAVLTGAGVASLGWFAWYQARHPRPLVRLHALRERTFQVGLALYALYYYVSNALGYLSSRLIEGGLGYPVENTGTLLGLTSLASLAMLYGYFRYSKLISGKRWLIVAGFLSSAFVAARLAQMPPDASEPWLVLPLVLRGLLLLFIALPVASLTFRAFVAEEFSHSYRLKNIVRQLTFSFATATMIILEQHLAALHWTRLAELLTPTNPQVQSAMDALSRTFESLGRTSAEAHAMALAEIGRMVEQQASYLSTLDGFHFILGVSMGGGLLAAWQRRIN